MYCRRNSRRKGWVRPLCPPMPRAITISKRMAAPAARAAMTKGKITGVAKEKIPARKPTNTAQAASIVTTVFTDLNRPIMAPTLPRSARSMEMASFKGMNRCMPMEWRNRKASITP